MLSVHLVLVIQQQVRDIWLTEIEGSAHTVMDIQFSDEIAYACHRHLNKCDVIKLCDSLNIVMCMCVCVCDDDDDGVCVCVCVCACVMMMMMVCVCVCVMMMMMVFVCV